MNHKKTIVICGAISALVIAGAALLIPRQLNKSSAANGKYSMTINSSNGPSLSGLPSSGNFTVNTGDGNAIQFKYENLTAGSGLIGMFDSSSKLSNTTAITGMVSVTATFTGALHASWGLSSADAHSATLTSGSELDFPLTACYFELSTLSAVNLSSLTIKYNCTLSPEAEDAKAIEEKRVELLANLDYAREQYRSDEIAAIDAAAQTVRTQILDENASLSDLNAISFAPFTSALAAAKTNAELMVEEAFEYPHLSRWALVNEHAATYTNGGAEFRTPGMGGTDVGYITSPGVYQGGFSAVMRCNNTATVAKDFGIIIGNDSSAGDGIDGYMLSWNYSIGDHIYLQVFKLINGYSTYGELTFSYIGGWIYNRGSMDLRNDDIRVIYDGENITLMNNDDYLNGENLYVTVPLNVDGYSLAPGASYRFTYANWDGSSANRIQIKEFAMATTVNSRTIACNIADDTIAKYNLASYSASELTQINAKIAEIDALRSAGTYAQILAKVDELVALFASFKAAAQAEAKTVLDNMFAFGDNTKSTPSNSAAVNTNVAGWSHVANSNSFTTTSDTGYIMDAELHGDFTMTFKVSGVHSGNPYGNSCTKGILLGTNVAGDYFNGIYLALADDWGFQFHELNADGSSGINTPASTFRGGFAVNANNAIYKLVVVSGSVSVYSIDANGNEYRLSGVDGGFGNTNVWNVNVPTGRVGFVSWGGVSTFTLLEFKDL